MNKISLKSPGINLILISFAFTAMWIVGAFSIILSSLIPSLLSAQTLGKFCLASMYICSFIIPLVGLVSYIRDNKAKSSKYYLAIPLLISVFFMTLYRDINHMHFFYKVSLFGKMGFELNSLMIAAVFVFFALSALLFVYSAPKSKAKIMEIPYIFSILLLLLSITYAFTSIAYSFFVKYLPQSMMDSFGMIYFLMTPLFGLSLIWAGTKYDKE